MSPYRDSARKPLQAGDRVRIVYTLWQRLRFWLALGRPPLGAYWHCREGEVRELHPYFGCPCGSDTCPHGNEGELPGATVLFDEFLSTDRGVSMPLPLDGWHPVIVFPLQRIERLEQ